MSDMLAACPHLFASRCTAVLRLLQGKAADVPAAPQEPDAAAAAAAPYSADFVRRRLLVFAGIVIG